MTDSLLLRKILTKFSTTTTTLRRKLKMLQPIANIVITIFPDTLKILLDFSSLVNTKMMEEVFTDLVGNNLGIECSIGKEACSITHTRIWKSRDIALELMQILEAKDKMSTVYCQVEGSRIIQ